jgi:hypothetical protein
MVMVSCSAVAEEAMAPAMISPCTTSRSRAESIRLARNCESERMPITSASSPATLRKMMRRVRLEKLSHTKNSRPRCSSSVSLRAPPLSGNGVPSSGRSGSTSVLRFSGVLFSTISLPVAPPSSTPGRRRLPAIRPP